MTTANPRIHAVNQDGPWLTTVSHGNAVVLIARNNVLGGYQRDTMQAFRRIDLSKGQVTQLNRFFRERGIAPRDAQEQDGEVLDGFLAEGRTWTDLFTKRHNPSEERRGRDNPAEGIRLYGPGKFDTYADKYVWEVSLDGGADDELNDDSGAWHGLMRDGSTVFKDNDPFLEELTDEERELIQGSEVIILSESSDGFMSVRYFDNTREGEEAWQEYEEFEDVEE